MAKTKEEDKSAASPEKPKKTWEELEQEFLARNEKTKNAVPPTTNEALFRKRNKLAADTKIFIVVGGYGTLKKALRERGWFENPERSSTIFDLKFAIKASECLTPELKDHQMINHFAKNNVITTKTGLTASLKSLKWWSTVDVDSFYPKCFDLTDMADLEELKIDFKSIKALSVLKKFVKEDGKTKCIERL